MIPSARPLGTIVTLWIGSSPGILSPSTAAYDAGEKFDHYQQIPSLQEYVLVSQDKPLIERYVRQPDNDWLLTEFSGLDRVFEFASVPAKVPLSEIYRDVTFNEESR